MRIAIAEMKQETNSFVPFRTTIETFRDQYLFRGAEMLTAYGAERSEVPGMLDVLRAAGATAVPLLGTLALASGPVTRECFEALLGEIIERLMCDFVVDVADVARRCRQDLSEVTGAWPLLRRFRADGLVTVDDAVVEITPSGRPFVRAVCAAFDPEATGLVQKHSRVV